VPERLKYGYTGCPKNNGPPKQTLVKFAIFIAMLSPLEQMFPRKYDKHGANI